MKTLRHQPLLGGLGLFEKKNPNFQNIFLLCHGQEKNYDSIFTSLLNTVDFQKKSLLNQNFQSALV